MATPLTTTGTDPPEQGQLARLRNRLWLVQDVIPAENGEGERATRVDLECLDDDPSRRDCGGMKPKTTRKPQSKPAQPGLFDTTWERHTPGLQAAEPPTEDLKSPALSQNAQRILHYLQTHPGWHPPAELLDALDLSRSQWTNAIIELLASNLVEKKGKKRGAKYVFKGSKK